MMMTIKLKLYMLYFPF